MKKQKSKVRRLTTVQRIFVSYICICLVPIVLLTGALALSSYRTRQREEATRQTHVAESVARTLDSEFRRIKNLSLQLRDTSWVKKRGAVPGLYDEEFDINHKIAISSDLRGYTNANGILRRLSLVFPEKKEVFSSTGMYTAEDFFHSYSMERNQPPLEPQTVYDHLEPYLDGSLVTGAQLGMTGSSKGKIFYVEQLGNNLRSFLLAEISPASIRYMVSMIVPSDMVQFQIQTDSDSLTTLFLNPGNSKYEYALPSNYFPVKLVSGFTSVSGFSRRDALVVSVLVLVCLSFSINLALILTRLTYRPVKELLKHIQSKHTDTGGHMDDFALIEQAVSQLHTENETVLRMAEKYRENARETCLRRLLMDDYTPAQASEKLQEFDIPFSDDLCYFVLLMEQNKEAGSLDLPLEEALSQFDLQYETVTLSKKRTATIIAIRQEERSRLDLPTLIQRIIFTCREHSDDQPAVICGKPESGISGIARSYANAAERMQSRLSDTIRSAASERRYYFPTEWAMQLINHVKFGQEDLSREILVRLQQENEKKNMDMQHLLTMLAQTYGNIIRELAADPQKYEAQFDAIANESTADGMWEQMFRLNKMICCEKTATNQDANIELQLVAYVKEHLTDPDISLKELSSRFNLSVSAISKLFKRACGINFYDFLLSSRMDTACEIIKTQKISLSAVARAVGYENEYSFKRAFSRFYGMSVSEYLRKNNAGMNIDK